MFDILLFFSIKSMILIAVRNLFQSTIYFMSYSLHKYFPFFFYHHFFFSSTFVRNRMEWHKSVSSNGMMWVWEDGCGGTPSPSPSQLPPSSHRIYSMGVCQWQQSNGMEGFFFFTSVWIIIMKLRERNWIRGVRLYRAYALQQLNSRHSLVRHNSRTHTQLHKISIFTHFSFVFVGFSLLYFFISSVCRFPFCRFAPLTAMLFKYEFTSWYSRMSDIYHFASNE